MDAGFELKHEHPKLRANCFSKLMFFWMVGLFRKTKFEIIDLYKTLHDDRSDRLAAKLEEHWKNELVRAKGNQDNASLLRAIFKAFGFHYLMWGLVWCFQLLCLRSLQPVYLSYFIKLFVEPGNEDRSLEMYLASAILVANSLLVVFLNHHNITGLANYGMWIRTATSALIYRKIMKLSQKSLGRTAVGQVVNLLSNDVNRFDLVVLYLHALWIMPFQVMLVSYFIWKQVGISSLAGILSMALFSIPLQGYLGNLTGKLRYKIAHKTDRRVKLMSEIVSGIQVIKMYAWEKPFERVIKLARADEIKDLTKTSYLRGIFCSCMVFLERLTLFLTLLVYVLLGHVATADQVFSMAQFFNILQLAVAILYPQAVSYGAEAWVSVKRLEEFLLLDENEVEHIESQKDVGIQLKNVSASWDQINPVLENISLDITPGSLCAIIGPVGAGKSSLFQLLLGELPLSSGNLKMSGDISYSSQEPWLFASSVKNNILFGQDYDKIKYQKVVKVCALEKDFDQFPFKDNTIVGERGVSLSGGQRARINLARAIYRRADIYLLDDPLSAVDTHVGKHLFEECIFNHLKNKTRILVTHQLQYLKKANLIIVFNEGRIEAQGSFEELSQSKLDFAKFLMSNEEQGPEKRESRYENEGIEGFRESRDRTLSVLPSQRSVRPSNPSVCSSRLSAPPSRLSSISTRLSAISSAESVVSTSVDALEPLQEIQEETSDPNATPLRNYFKSVNNFCLLFTLSLILICAQAFCTGADYFVAYWTNQEEIKHSVRASVVTKFKNLPLYETTQTYNADNIYDGSLRYYPQLRENNSVLPKHLSLDIFEQVEKGQTVYTFLKTDMALYIYGTLIIAAVILTLGRSILFFKICMKISQNLHSQMFHCLLKAPMRFFDTNSSGRILNRFSKDMGAIDELLPRVLLDAIQILLVMAGILVNVGLSNPYIIIALVVLVPLFLKIQRIYISTAKKIKHIEGIAKSPIFTHVKSSLLGLTTIRASKVEDTLVAEFDHHQDVHSSAWHLTIACMEAFGLWLDIICVIFTGFVTFSFVLLNQYSNAINSSLVGLAISQSLILTGMLQFGMQQTSQVVNQLTSVERVLQYTNVTSEGPFETSKNKTIKKRWPNRGLIEFRKLYLKYAEEEPPVLKDLNLTISPGAKIGIVGRTGAGKSSLISALFRLTTLEGSIIIDGVDTQDIGLSDLRKRISIIPQEPVLFSETMRYNLDPFNEFEDTVLWQALEEVDLKDSVTSLDYMVSEGGVNFSLGQRQLICLARAILRNNKVLVLDEATANVDPKTDSFIQTTIRKKFKDCTVLTIAHRLNTIMDSDKVLVMSFGQMMEFDHPHKLLQIQDGFFHKMVLETGPSMSLQLKSIAARSYYNKFGDKN